MNEETREFLLECKKAGYEHVAICVEDKRVPISIQIEKRGQRKYGVNPSAGEYWGVEGSSLTPLRIVCAAPNRRDSGFPAIWKICKDSDLTAGMAFRGLGHGEAHQIRKGHKLEHGYYDLKSLN